MDTAGSESTTSSAETVRSSSLKALPSKIAWRSSEVFHGALRMPRNVVANLVGKYAQKTPRTFRFTGTAQEMSISGRS